ncbi:MAG TPA: DUF1501 domain-containing protein [Steroidobacteraceae bacterium]|nr:DUF1501 domain-containing protein [Steroidobacteraceae bacterium]
MKRRDFLTAGTLAASGALLTSRLSFANTATTGKSRFVFVILRGALDGLAAVPPYGDRDYASLRHDLAMPANSVLPLNDLFGLHPSLTFLRESFGARELIVFHAIASPYRERSHFDGQDVLESGYVRAHAAQSGWLNRALAAIPKGRVSETELGVALGQNTPLVMRGPAAVTSWSPSKLAALDEDTLERITDLYSGDPVLAARLADALAADAIADSPMMSAGDTINPGGAVSTVGAVDDRPSTLAPAPRNKLEAARGGGARYAEVIHAAAEFLRRDDGPKVAVFDTTGWDTHANEGAAQGQLAGRLAALDSGLRALKQQLGPVWNDTAVLLATEFGRTAAINGTRGTDHGTATAAFLLGGAVRGGRVIADWPGLSSRALYQGRDLMPTQDLRSVLKGVLEEHLSIPARAFNTTVFPDSGAAKALSGLVRT